MRTVSIDCHIAWNGGSGGGGGDDEEDDDGDADSSTNVKL